MAKSLPQERKEEIRHWLNAEYGAVDFFWIIERKHDWEMYLVELLPLQWAEYHPKRSFGRNPLSVKS